MIGYLRGTVYSISLDALVLDVGGVGYCVTPTSSILSQAAQKSEISLWIHTHVREDALQLFGFSTQDELEFFRQLLTVSGVGPKLAMTILSTSADMVKGAIVNGDDALLARIPGIGKKTAARIILDLKNKVALSATHQPYAARTGLDDAIAALMNLGYDRGMVTRALGDLPASVETTEDIVKYFLKNA